MNREQIYLRVIESADRFGPNNPQQFQFFGSMLAKCNPEEVFWGLILVFQRNKAYNHQELAGRLLEKMKPHYLFDLTTTLRSIIDNWDVSVEQLPIHFARMHGKDAVIRELSIMEKESLPEESLRYRKIETMGWWLTGSSLD